jgi:hypothetical protein
MRQESKYQKIGVIRMAIMKISKAIESNIGGLRYSPLSNPLSCAT